MFCSDCGQQNADDAKFCQKCGKKFVAVETLSSQSPEPEKPSTPASQDSVQPRSFVDTNTHVSTELKDSGTVTAMSVVGFVFGLIGMLGSFIPCIGSLAFFIGIPAALISAIALGIAYSQNAKKTFAIVAVTISLIGVVISGWQYFSIISAGENARKETEKMLNQGQRQQERSKNVNTAMSTLNVPQKNEGQQMEEQANPYRTVLNSTENEDKKTIARIYLERPYSFECSTETVDQQINMFEDFIARYPHSTFVNEALVNIAWLELYLLQCEVPVNEKLARLEKAKTCYKKIFTGNENGTWGKTAKKLHEVLSTDERSIEGIGYSKISSLHDMLSKQVPLCANQK